MTRVCCAGIIVCSIIGCVTNPESNRPTTSLSFPLAVGNSWTYHSVWTLGDSTVDSSLQTTTITARESDSAGNDIFDSSRGGSTAGGTGRSMLGS